MAYWYRGRRYPSKPPVKVKVKAAIKHLASRAWESIQGGHPPGGGGRPDEHYVADAMRQVNAALAKASEEKGEEPKDDIKLMW
jgi:hypothetical protein